MPEITQATDLPIYEILDKGTPRIFAPRPIYNTLQNRMVKLCSYASGTGLRLHDEITPETSFTDIDADVWARQFLSAFDTLLSPAFKSSMELVGRLAETPQDFLKRFQDSKESLAGSISELMVAVYRGQPADGEGDAREAFRQAILEQLGNAYSTDAALQFTAKVNAPPVPANQAAPQLHDPPAPKVTDPTLRLAAAKLDPAPGDENDPALLTFLLAAKKQDGGDLTGFVRLKDVTFNGTAIGHQTGKPPGIKEGYTVLSWLSCLLPCFRGNRRVTPRNPTQAPLGDRPPMSASLGTFDVPMVLRSCPTPLRLACQNFAKSRGHQPDSSDDAGPPPLIGWCVDLDELTRSDYSFIYGEDYHHPQDRTYFEVKFNVEDQGAMETAVEQGVIEAEVQELDLVQSLAQFVSLFPAIDADLVLSDPRIGIGCITVESKPEDIEIVAAALDAFATIAEWIAHAWESATALFGAPGLTSDLGGAYDFYIAESAQETGDDDSPLVITLQESVVRPERIGPPVVRISGYDTKVDPVSSTLATKFKYTFSKAGTPLTAKEGLQIANRQVWIPGMVPLERENAFLEACLVRNSELVPGKMLADSFVYRAATVKFANPVQPFIDFDTKLDIACVGSNRAQSRSLARQLANMFDNLFEFEPQQFGPRNIGLECHYEYQLSPDLPSVSIPVLMLPPTDFAKVRDTKVPEGGCTAGDTGSLVCNIENEINVWLNKQKLSSVAGTLVFDLTVYSTLSKQPMPLLRLRRLELSLDHLSPRLALKPTS